MLCVREECRNLGWLSSFCLFVFSIKVFVFLTYVFNFLGKWGLLCIYPKIPENFLHVVVLQVVNHDLFESHGYPTSIIWAFFSLHIPRLKILNLFILANLTHEKCDPHFHVNFLIAGRIRKTKIFYWITIFHLYTNNKQFKNQVDVKTLFIIAIQI